MKKQNRIVVLILIVLLVGCGKTKNDSAKVKYTELDKLENTWQLNSEKSSISWDVNTEHTDHLEFSGLHVSAIVTYGNNSEGNLVLKKKVVWPMLRTIPNDTHASLIHDFDESVNSLIKVNNKTVDIESPRHVSFNGVLSINSALSSDISIKRVLSPSVDQAAIVEQITITNNSATKQNVEVDKLDYKVNTPKEEGVYGIYTIRAYNNNYGKFTLESGKSYTFSQIYAATKENESLTIDVAEEINKRNEFVQSLNNSLVFESPSENLNQMFRFAKIRATESIYATKGGLMHGPGGSRYYAAIWANDQAEYINPFFPFLGNNNGNESAINSFRHFARFMNDEFKPIPSSIVAEGIDIWNGVGDRGDAAMIAYGASRFALAYGDKNTADSLLPLIKWCLEYCEKQLLPEGVIASDCDELENRFPAGDANLTTNMLAYGGYISTAHLLNTLNVEPLLAIEYNEKADVLRDACEEYFGANVQGFDTYQYFEGNTKLRSWICIPLTVGVYERKEETLKALLSDKLWNKNGIFTEAGDSTFWDRATLYAFRGILKAGETDIAMDYLEYYTQKRLLGEHVPYAVEAYPEGNQRHLSAESGLYCRVITEGLFGIEPIGFNSFKCTPRLPKGWDYMRLEYIKAFQTSFDIEVNRNGSNTEVIVKNNKQIVKKTIWDGNSEIIVEL